MQAVSGKIRTARRSASNTPTGLTTTTFSRGESSMASEILALKRCNHCKQLRPIVEFGVLRSSPDGRAPRCKPCQSSVGRKHYYKTWRLNRPKRNRQQTERYAKAPDVHAKYARDRRRWLRLKTLEIYGGKCSCCGEREETFLSIDHVNGDGNKHRREVGNNSISVLQAIRREGYPPDKYQVLCFNCNRSKFVLGVCAHQKEKT
jgi:hypothetical protein